MKIGLAGIKEAIAADMVKWENLSEAIATILHLQTVNTSEIAAGLHGKQNEWI
jgi:hypothetical protein